MTTNAKEIPHTKMYANIFFILLNYETYITIKCVLYSSCVCTAYFVTIDLIQLKSLMKFLTALTK